MDDTYWIVSVPSLSQVTEIGEMLEDELYAWATVSYEEGYKYITISLREIDPDYPCRCGDNCRC